MRTSQRNFTHQLLRSGVIFLNALQCRRSRRFMQSKRPLGQLEIARCEHHQLLGHARLSTRPSESKTSCGEFSMVFGAQHSRTMTPVTGSLNRNRGRRFKFH
jgi:hypothetical protein